MICLFPFMIPYDRLPRVSTPTLLHIIGVTGTRPIEAGLGIRSPDKSNHSDS